MVIFHGFGATPYEMFHVAQAIAELPLDVYVPLLPKHGVNSELLSELKLLEVIEWAIDYIEEIKKKYDRVFILGHSMGSGLTYHIITSLSDIDGVIISALGKDFTWQMRFLTWLAEKLKIKYMRGVFGYLRRSKVIDPDYIEWKKIFFPKQPVLLMREVINFAPNQFVKLPNITIPFMLIAGTYDFLSSADYMEEFLQQTKSRRKIALKLKGGDHQIFLSKFKFKVILRIISFLRELLVSEPQNISGIEFHVLRKNFDKYKSLTLSNSSTNKQKLYT